MAAPSATVRQDPTGIMLENGYRSLLTFTRFPAVNLWEKTVQPPEAMGGDAIDISTMHNDTYRTKAHSALVDFGEGQATVAYDAGVLTTIMQMINVYDTMTITYPDGSTEAYYGYLKSFARTALAEGEFPEATIIWVPTNRDIDNNVEAGPTVTSVAGT